LLFSIGTGRSICRVEFPDYDAIILFALRRGESIEQKNSKLCQFNRNRCSVRHCFFEQAEKNPSGSVLAAKLLNPCNGGFVLDQEHADFALPPGLPATDEKLEQSLLHRVQKDVRELTETLWQLFLFYDGLGRNELCAGVVSLIMRYCHDPEDRAYGYLILGQLAERSHKYAEALEHYARGIELKPSDKKTAYFLHNNTAYCLNQQGRYAEAERNCWLAIGIEAQLANAYKNLGISLAGQNDTAGAMRAYIEALRWFFDPNPYQNPCRRHRR
jgi:tetratricopeptide (TPR) repeat protein